MSDQPALRHLSDRFLAHAAIAACRPSTARALADLLTLKLATPEGRAMRPEKRADMESLIGWLRMSGGSSGMDRVMNLLGFLNGACRS